MKSVTTQRAILVVEADRALRDWITRTLRRDNYFVLAVTDGATALEVAQANPFALILLDPMGLQPDGPDTCRRSRAFPETAFVPILMVTDEADITRMATLDLGVDDYITKPLNLEMLRACVRALLRGSSRRSVRTWNRPMREATGEEGRILAVGDVCIDVMRRKVIRGDQVVELRSALLFDLLAYLVRHRGVVLTREQLLMQVWGYERASTGDTRTVDVHVSWLRQKLEDDPENPELIQTVRGVGYSCKE